VGGGSGGWWRWWGHGGRVRVWVWGPVVQCGGSAAKERCSDTRVHAGGLRGCGGLWECVRAGVEGGARVCVVLCGVCVHVRVCCAHEHARARAAAVRTAQGVAVGCSGRPASGGLTLLRIRRPHCFTSSAVTSSASLAIVLGSHCLLRRVPHAQPVCTRCAVGDGPHQNLPLHHGRACRDLVFLPMSPLLPPSVAKTPPVAQR